MGIKMPETCWDSVNNQHPQLTINHLYCCILLVFFPHALLTMHGHRNIKLPISSVTDKTARRNNSLDDCLQSQSCHAIHILRPSSWQTLADINMSFHTVKSGHARIFFPWDRINVPTKRNHWTCPSSQTHTLHATSAGPLEPHLYCSRMETKQLKLTWSFYVLLTVHLITIIVNN